MQVNKNEEEMHERHVAFIGSVSTAATPRDVLNRLHHAVRPIDISVQAAVRLPKHVSDWDALQRDRTVFIHEDMPKGWWEEWLRMVRRGNQPIGYLFAASGIAPYTYSEAAKAVGIAGIDRWEQDLAIKYGVRDAFFCPIGGRWVLVYVASRDLSGLPTHVRVMLFSAASCAVARLEQLIEPVAPPTVPELSPREIAVLRALSTGNNQQEVADHLGMNKETLKTHLRRAQQKLGVQNSLHAVAEAIRRGYIH